LARPPQRAPRLAAAVSGRKSCGGVKQTNDRKEKKGMQKITPFLWFDGKAEEAANFYVSIFKNAKIVSVSRWGEGARDAPKGGVMSATIEIDGQRFIAILAKDSPATPLTVVVNWLQP